MLTLGIETTCDETACAIVRNGREILANVVSSQIDLHAEYGGVVPELACRRHLELLIPVIQQALNQAEVRLEEINLISVAQGPGLIGALLIGLNAAKALSLALDIPYIGVDHVEAHLYAAWMSHSEPISFPCLGVVLSGGHTSLMTIPKLGQSQIVSQTVDDAIGEAFDKVAKILGLPYPGGPHIEQLASQGDSAKFKFSSGRVKESPLDFSFSGLKTAVLYACKDLQLSYKEKTDIAASFQKVAFQDVVNKCMKVSEMNGYTHLLFGGGVTNNQKLREMFKHSAPQLTCVWPALGLSLDNAAMIAGLGYQKYIEKGQGDNLHLEPYTRINKC